MGLNRGDQVLKSWRLASQGLFRPFFFRAWRNSMTFLLISVTSIYSSSFVLKELSRSFFLTRIIKLIVPARRCSVNVCLNLNQSFSSVKHSLRMHSPFQWSNQPTQGPCLTVSNEPILLISLFPKKRLIPF